MAQPFFEGAFGHRALLLTEAEPPGIYMHAFWQGTPHGSEKATGDLSAAVPVLQGIAGWPSDALDRMCGRLLSDYGCAAACVAPSGGIRAKACDLWVKDLAAWGGRLPFGRPNSEKWGAYRALGIGHSPTACFLRQLPEVRRFWDNCAVAFGREPVFRDADAPGETEAFSDGLAPFVRAGGRGA